MSRSDGLLEQLSVPSTVVLALFLGYTWSDMAFKTQEKQHAY